MATLVALEPFAAVIADYSKLLALSTLRSAETLRPAGKLQCREALFLNSISLDEIGKGKTLLVLNFVLGHAMVLQQRASTSVAAGWRGIWELAELCR
jgi:hypothetical protein